MIAADSSSVINFLKGADTTDRRLVRQALSEQILWLPPVVIAEILSAPAEAGLAKALVAQAPMLALIPGYWERTGENRRLLLQKGLKAKLADALVAQCCIDADVPLIARDDDFRHFAQWCGLKLAV